MISTPSPEIYIDIHPRRKSPPNHNISQYFPKLLNVHLKVGIIILYIKIQSAANVFLL